MRRWVAGKADRGIRRRTAWTRESTLQSGFVGWTPMSTRMERMKIRAAVGRCYVLIAVVNVNRFPNGSFTDISRVPQGIASIPGRAYA